jgi:hypothetical protein
VPTAAAQLAETMAGMHRTAAASGRLPARKRAATAETLRQIVEPIPPDLAGLRDRALRAWQHDAGITEGAVFRRTWTPPRGRDGRNTPLPRVGAMAIDAGTVARIIQTRAARAGFDPKRLGADDPAA